VSDKNKTTVDLKVATGFEAGDAHYDWATFNVHLLKEGPDRGEAVEVRVAIGRDERRTRREVRVDAARKAAELLSEARAALLASIADEVG